MADLLTKFHFIYAKNYAGNSDEDYRVMQSLVAPCDKV
jgi:hypothetical protein